jgi:negative regulator of flagellin synthesis FlgM
MRIDQAYGHAPTATDASAARPASTERAAASSTGAAQTTAPPITVTVSDKARALSTQSTEVSAAKVATLQQSIADGTFQINPQAIADKIVGGD